MSTGRKTRTQVSGRGSHPRLPSRALAQPIFEEPTPVFNEGTVTPDPTGFNTIHADDTAVYRQIEQLLTEAAVGFDPSTGAPGDRYALASALGPHGADIVAQIAQAGRIVFHAVGDTGASNPGNYHNELGVADRLTNDCHVTALEDRPAFLYLLGDLVYDFGEPKYYYDQFYDPFRNYPGPIFAIPGNHESFVLPGTPTGREPLVTFRSNFCATDYRVTPEAGSLHRTAMRQPGVYFALDAPFVRVIGLFSNALEDPGVISSDGGKWPSVPDIQLDFLRAQLQGIQQEAYAGAVVLATHHPAFSYTPPAGSGGSVANHGSSTAMLRQIDSICAEVGVYPHAFLSGHAHNYQRYTRTVELAGRTMTVPFVVCGDGGHNVTPLVYAQKGQSAVEPAIGTAVAYMDSTPAIPTPSPLVLDRYDDRNYGFLRLTVDADRLSIAFNVVGAGTSPASPGDLVTVDLKAHAVVAEPGSPARPAVRRHR